MQFHRKAREALFHMADVLYCLKYTKYTKIYTSFLATARSRGWIIKWLIWNGKYFTASFILPGKSYQFARPE